MKFSQNLSNKKVFLIFLAIGIIIFGKSVFNDFIWDDEEQIVNNPSIKSVKNIPSFFRQSTFNSGGAANMGGLYYKPLMTTSFALMYPLARESAYIYHAFQILLHIVNSYLVFLILRKTLKTKNIPIALGLLFLIHPINVQPAIYLASYQDTLFFLFGALALLQVVKKAKNQTISTILVSTLLILSLFSKETGVIFVLAILFYSYIFPKNNAKKYLISIFSSLSVYLIFRLGLANIKLQKHGLTPISRESFSQRLISLPKIFFYYLKTFIYPKNLSISQHWMVEKPTLGSFWLPLLVVIVFLLLSVFSLYKLKGQNKKTYLLFFLIFISGISLHLQVFPLDLTVSNRWFYLPMLGLLGMMGVWFKKTKLKKKHTKYIITLLLTTYAFLAFRTLKRTFDWKNGYTLYKNDIKNSSSSFDLQNNYGVELYRKGDKNKALTHFQRSINIAPYWWTNWNNAGVILEEIGEIEKALNYYQKAIDNGDYYLAHENRARITLTKLKDYKLAQTYIEDSLQKLPNNFKLWKYYIQLKLNQGQTQEAKSIAASLYKENPNSQTYQLLQVTNQAE